MLGNIINSDNNMVVISPSTANEWPQNNHLVDEKGFLMASTGKQMEKPAAGQELSQQQQQQQQQQPLKCPRCDSSNTKFCYYNNYSLSQPRHFCKACKRYWTRGGTLRNVPVGGGCRKNKRVKRPASATEGPATISSSNPNSSSHQNQIDHISSSASNHINPLFYGLANNPSELNLPFPGRFSSRVLSSSMDAVTGYDLQPQLNALGLGFSSGIMTSTDANGFHPTKQIQDVITSNSLLSSYSSIFGSSSPSTTNSPAMSTFLASNLNQQKFTNGDIKDSRALNQFHNLTPFEDLQISGNSESGIGMKEVKTEQGQSRLDWNMPSQNHMEQIGFSSSDPSLYWGSATGVGAWNDPGNIGSSVTSLI